MEQQTSFFKSINQWIQESITVKLLSIGFLILILLIPTTWIQSLIEERQYRMSEAISEVEDKWSGRQTLSGPVMIIPYKKYLQVEKEGKTEVIEKIEKAYFLPENLQIHADLEPQNLNRGIFDVVVYNSVVNMSGTFGIPDLSALNLKEENILWEDAILTVGLSDLRGIKDDPEIMFSGKTFESEPGQNVSNLFDRNISSRLKFQDAIKEQHKFSIKFPLKGSGKLFFIPTGKNTDVSVVGSWPDPSFGGSFIPETREVSESGFDAKWKVLHFNRPFPQQWVGAQENFQEAAFGVDLLMPVDQYQKSIRTAKYAVLIILLTFLALFLIEIICKIRIHPFQYILIGAALIIYYSLLLSLSEHSGFEGAYLIASISTVILISFYSTSFLPAKKIGILLGGLLSLFYAFIYTIIRSQDYALLFGSVGLFIAIAVLMYISRKINWYGNSKEPTDLTIIS